MQGLLQVSYTAAAGAAPSSWVKDAHATGKQLEPCLLCFCKVLLLLGGCIQNSMDYHLVSWEVVQGSHLRAGKFRRCRLV